MKKLITMADFVLEQEKQMQLKNEYEFTFGITGRCFSYANFLKQTPTIGMFIKQGVINNKKPVFKGFKFKNGYSESIVIVDQNQSTIEFFNDGKVCVLDVFLVETIEELLFHFNNIEESLEMDYTIFEELVV